MKAVHARAEAHGRAVERPAFRYRDRGSMATIGRNHAVAAPMKPDRLLTSWILAVAIAEVGMILGFVFAFLSRSLTPFVVGAVVFAVSLLVLTAAISQVDLET